MELLHTETEREKLRAFWPSTERISSDLILVLEITRQLESGKWPWVAFRKL